MRIRKRFPPSSPLSPAPLSDPQLNPSLLNTAHLHVNLFAQEEVKTNPNRSDPQNQSLQQPTVEERLIGSEKPKWACTRNRTEAEEMKQKEIDGEEIKDERRKKEEEKSSNDIRKESNFLSAEMDTQFPESSSSALQVDRWCNGDKVVPLKKRKGSFERILGKETILKAKMKSKTNKKCMKQNVDGQEEEKKETSKEGFDSKNATSGGAKKNKRGSVIMEGSRCSRVNGRGWRCCQQTLVGYSLCEHHLGKGRLRSMTSFRNRAMANHIINAEEKDETSQLSNLQEKQQMKSLSSNKDDIDDHDDDDEGKPLMVTKKRMKLGAIKARSISSLLGQTENAANSNKIGNSG